MLTRKSFFAFVAVLTVATSMAAASTASAAAGRACVKKGYEVSYRDAINVVLRRDVSKDYWEDDAWAQAVCSRRYGRAVSIGESGITPDGPVWSSLYAMNSRYAAVVTGYGGNADGGSDDGIFVVDLKTGKKVSSGSPSVGVSEDEDSVLEVALSPSGAVGWINGGNYESGAVNVRYPNGRAKRFPASDSLNTDFLRWSDDGKRLLWTEAPTQVAYKHPKYKDPKPNKRGRCLRSGDRVEGRDYSYVYVTRPTRTRGWKHARSLIACSYSYRKRVTIARSGVREGTTYSFRTPKVTAGFAAVVTDRKSASGAMGPLLSAFDLGRARRTCITELGSGLENPKVGTFEAVGASLFWNVTGRTADATNVTQLRVCDDAGARTLFTNTDLDPQFMSFNPDGVLVVVNEKSGA